MLRRALTAAVLVAASVGGVLAGAAPASAAGPWYVKPTGNNAANCLSPATACATVTGALAKAGFQPGDTINVDPGTYTDRPAVTKAAKIVGSGPGVVFRGAAGAWALAVNTNATPGASVELRNLTLTAGGFASGGALPVVAAHVIATDVQVTNSTGVIGGGVYVFSGSLSMNGGRIQGNQAVAGAANQGWGGGAYVAPGAALNLDGTTVAGNRADASTKSAFAFGGAIVNGGITSIEDARLSNNIAVHPSNSAYGGAIYNAGPSLSIANTEIDGNTAAIGGALSLALSMSGTGLDIHDNTALLGGGIHSAHALGLANSAIVDNTATTSNGGGIYSTSTQGMILDNVEVAGNDAAVAGGGVMSTAGGIAIRNGSRVADNTAQVAAGVYNAGNLTVRSSEIVGNAASFQAGGILNGSQVATDSPHAQLLDADVSNNTAAVAGGGIVNLAKANLSMYGGRIADNGAAGGGGLLVADGSTALLDGTDVVGNTATSLGGGGIFNSGSTVVFRGTIDANVAATANGLGGGIYSGSSTAGATTKLDVFDSTISHNQAYAGSALVVYSTGSGASNATTIDDSTISGNTSTSVYGAIEQVGRPVTINHSTITDNVAAAGGAGAIYAGAPAGGGVSNTVFAGNTPRACLGPVASNGGNHGGPGQAGCGLTPGADPQLGPLADNGGPTLTQLPGPASPLLDVLDCPGDDLDQRGVIRPQGSQCDIGSVEAQQIAPTIEGGPTHVDLAVGSSADPAASFTSTGSPQPDLSATGVPDGLTFTDNGDGTGTLSGTPAAGTGGVHTVTVMAVNEAGNDTIDIEVEIAEAPELSGPTSSTYVVGEPGGPDVFEQVGGHPVATLSTDSDLPGGVTFADNGDGTGTLGGTPQPTTGGLYDVTIDGSNGVGPDATWPFALTVNEAPSLSAPDATFRVGTAGSSALTVGGFPAPTVTATGLPAGLAVDGAAITGTPAAGSGGVHAVDLTATNGVGADATDSATITVEEAATVAGPLEVRMVAGSQSSASYAASGFPVPALSAAGDLPAGVTFVDNGDGTATLSGTPAAGATGSYQLAVTAANGIGEGHTITVSLEVVPPVQITTTSLPGAAFGSPYDQPVQVAGGVAPYAFSLASGALPQGLTLGDDGRITGTPTGSPGTSTFTVRVEDGTGHEDTQQLSITVGKGVSSLIPGPVVVVGNVLLGGDLTATLLGGPGTPIAGATVTFRATNAVLGNPVACTAVTDANGIASCKPTVGGLTAILLAPSVTISWPGDSRWLPATAVAPKKLGPPAPWT